MSLISSTIAGNVQREAGALLFTGSNAFGDDLQFGPSDVLAIELRSPSPGGHDRLAVQGDAVLGGNLSLRTRTGFALAHGEAVEIVTIGGEVSGQFAGLPEGALVVEHERLRLFITYAGGDGNDVAIFARRMGADFNEDGFVNGTDLAIWESGFAETDAADSNADGVTNGFDLLACQRQYGLAVQAATAAVPEAHSLLTVAMALLALLAKRQVFGKPLAQ